MMEVVNVEHKTVLEGETRIAIDTDDGLYIVIVPIMGLFLGHKPGANAWAGVILGAAGLYLLSIKKGFTISQGDLLVLISAFFWSIHVHVIGYLSAKRDPIKLAFSQFLTCSILSAVVAVLTEYVSLQDIIGAAIPILYGGLLSVGVAFTLQVVAQKHAPPTHAVIIMSLETLFAAIGGWLILGETLSTRGGVGCALMLLGAIISQIHFDLQLPKKKKGQKEVR